MKTVINALFYMLGIGILALLLWPSDEDTSILVTGSGTIGTKRPMEEIFDKAGLRTEGDFEHRKEPDWGKTPPAEK